MAVSVAGTQKCRPLLSCVLYVSFVVCQKTLYLGSVWVVAPESPCQLSHITLGILERGAWEKPAGYKEPSLNFGEVAKIWGLDVHKPGCVEVWCSGWEFLPFEYLSDAPPIAFDLTAFQKVSA